MRGPIRSVLLAAVAVCAFAALTVGSASAALLGQPGNTPFLAIYGSPGSNGATTVPVGGGLGRNFGFGENMEFEANTTTPREPLEITLGGVVAKSEQAELGGTLMSNKTGANNPLSFTIQFVDFQHNTLGGAADPAYSDTSDRPWITEICSLAAVGEACKTDAQYKQGNKPGGVKIENVSFNIGPGIVVQGTVWGKWKDGTITTPACITLEKPAAGEPTLVDTQGGTVGNAIEAIKGTACLRSANNDWYSGKENVAITIKNE